jgi:PAS domain S-box-containing protein
MSAIEIKEKVLGLRSFEDQASQHEALSLNEKCKTLFSIFPAAIAQFRPLAPVSLNGPTDVLVSSIMNAQIVDGNGNFARMHGFTNLEDLRGKRLSKLVPHCGCLEQTLTAWIEHEFSTHSVIIDDALARDHQTQVELKLTAEIRDDLLVSFWIMKHGLKTLKPKESSFRNTEGQLRTVLNQVSELVLIQDLDSRYIDANTAAERILGLNRPDIIGKTPEDIWGTELGSEIKNYSVRALQGMISEHICTRHFHSISNAIHLVTTPVYDLDGNVIGALEIGHIVPDHLENPGRGKKTNPFRKPSLPVCNSEAMRKTLETALIAANTDAVVLILGETGAGKDFLASLIHDRSSRAARPLISINCASVPFHLAESELFGHEVGAFTGANKRKKGLLELAHGGTLLMNEIGDLPLLLQAKLLTFLDTKSFTRVGGEKQISVDVRILAATNRDLRNDVIRGLFRRDLFYRLNVITLSVPPLRERPEDLPALINEILVELAKQNKLPDVPDLDPSVLQLLKTYDWPGNVRELKSVLQRLLLFSPGDVIDADSLGLNRKNGERAFTTHFPSRQSLNELLDDLKHSLIEDALRRTGGRRKEAADLLGVTRNSLKHHMRGKSYRADRSNQSSRKMSTDDL